MSDSHGVVGLNVTDSHSSSHHRASTTIVTVDWIGLVILLGSSIILCYKLMTFKGPSEQPVDYFFGYRESKMLSVYVNLFAAVAYWLKVSSHANGDEGLIATLESIKYLEYAFTCPLLTVDLLWTLNLPYKFTYGANILVCIICATFASLFEGPARYMWFVFGSVLFAVTWTAIVTLVRRRLEQFYSSNIYSKNIRKETKSMLRTALFSYFSLWVAYPVLWVLLETNCITEEISHCLHVFLDVSAKSAYGFAMLRFQLSSERREFTLDPLSDQMLVVCKPADTDDGSKSSSDDDLDNGQASASFVKVQYPASSPQIGARRISTVDLRLAAAGNNSAVNGRLLTPRMDPVHLSGPVSLEPFDRTLSASTGFGRAPSAAGAAGYYDHRGRISRSQTPAESIVPREVASPRVRRLSVEPPAAAAAAAGGVTPRQPPLDSRYGTPAESAGGDSETANALRSLSDHLTRLLQAQAAAAAAAHSNNNPPALASPLYSFPSPRAFAVGPTSDPIPPPPPPAAAAANPREADPHWLGSGMRNGSGLLASPVRRRVSTVAGGGAAEGEEEVGVA